MNRQTSPADTAAQFAALGDRTRLELLIKLGRLGPQPIKHLCVGAAVSRQAITKHLRVLQAADLVEERIVGREHRFAVKPQSLQKLHLTLDEIAQQWDNALVRLKNFVEENQKPTS